MRVDCEVGATRMPDMVMGEALKDDRGAGIDQGERRGNKTGKTVEGGPTATLGELGMCVIYR